MPLKFYMQVQSLPKNITPPHLWHVATLYWEIKSSNFLQMWKKMQKDCIFNTYNFVIHPQLFDIFGV